MCPRPMLKLVATQISKSVLLKSFEKLISLRAVLPLDAEEVFFSTPSSISGNPLRFQVCFVLHRASVCVTVFLTACGG